MNCWWSKDVGLLALLISLVISTTATVEDSPSSSSSISPHLTSTPAQVSATHTSITSLPVVTPTPTPTTPPVTSTTPPSTSTTPPGPTSSPGEDFIRYKDDYIYLIIENINIRYNDVTVWTANISQMHKSYEKLTPQGSQITFNRTYSLNGEPHFTFSFVFTKDGDSSSWYMENFRHRNFSENEDMLFQYRGIRYSIVAPMDKHFLCSTGLVFHGVSGGDTGVISTLNFEGITAQAFITNGELSSESVICGQDPDQNPEFNIGVLIGVVVGVCCLLLVGVILGAVLLVRRTRRRGYNLLDK